MNFIELTTESEILDLIERHNKESEYVVLDTETTGLNSFSDRITDVVLMGIELDTVFSFAGAFVNLLTRLRKPIVAHNFKFDFTMCFRGGVDLRSCGLFADTMLIDHLLDENVRHGLDEILQRKYNVTYKEEFWSKYKNFTDAPRSEQLTYACSDVYYTRRLFEDQRRELKEQDIPQTLVDHVHALGLSLLDMELNGIGLDLEYLNKMSTQLSIDILALRHKMRDAAEWECTSIETASWLKEMDKRKTDKGKQAVKMPIFNFDSSLQLTSLLYDKLKLPVQFSKTHSRTVDDAALEKLESKHRVIPHIREYRGLQKVYTSFIEGSLSKMQGGRVYPSFNVNGTVTGRISSSGPNMQQLPKDGGVRGIYIPAQGSRFISCDYSQLEVTLAAHFSRDVNLLKIVFEGASQHDITAQGLGIPRAQAKTINFAMQYGAGVKKVQAILGCSEKDAEGALRKYWETYAGLDSFIKYCHSQVDAGTPLINPFGRRRRFPTTFKDKWERQRAYRQAANSLIQGTGADITNKAFYLVDTALKDYNYGRGLFPVHDELLVEVSEASTEVVSEYLKKTMVDMGKRINLTVPLSVQCSKPMLRWEKS